MSDRNEFDERRRLEANLRAQVRGLTDRAAFESLIHGAALAIYLRDDRIRRLEAQIRDLLPPRNPKPEPNPFKWSGPIYGPPCDDDHGWTCPKGHMTFSTSLPKHECSDCRAERDTREKDGA